MTAPDGYPSSDRPASDLAPPPAGPAPGGRHPGWAAWLAGIDRAREALATAPDRDPGGARTCTATRCKQLATDLSGLCPRHIAKAASR